jgi:hypothetical protein
MGPFTVMLALVAGIDGLRSVNEMQTRPAEVARAY